ncbi:MAG TPA: cob(I)yrinic acid a,c-diamide adenosyltransferase [Longimicrobiales bacterium]
MPRIYTRTGDRGETGLLGGGRVPKAHPRVEAYGAVDELNSVIGWALVLQQDAEVRRKLGSIQPDLFTLGAHLAAPPATGRRRRPVLPELGADRVAELERWIDEADAELPELHAFILPGGSPAGAALHVARTVCRRAERRVVALAEHEHVAEEIIIYLNRLSDLLFMLARLANHRAGAAETLWEPRAR